METNERKEWERSTSYNLELEHAFAALAEAFETARSQMPNEGRETFLKANEAFQRELVKLKEEFETGPE